MNARIVKIGNFKTGVNNTITDVPGVLVGHVSIQNDTTNTGITCILPHNRNLFEEKVVAASYVFNGFGKSVGLMQIDELGTIETPILLTNTLSVGIVSDGLISYMLKDNPEIGKKLSTVNSLVLECNDGSINDIQNRILTKDDVYLAINNAGVLFDQGGVGAGAGMKCHGFKGGIGSSSRVINIDGKEYVIGVLVNSNFGSSNGTDLIFKGRAMGELIKNYDLPLEDDKGSIIVVLATNLPLNERQLKRVCKRCELGIARTGSYAGHGSGDIMVAFTTQNMVKLHPNSAVSEIISFSDNYLNCVFKAAVDATEEAVLNSMLYAKGVQSYNGNYIKSLMEYKSLFEDLLN